MRNTRSIQAAAFAFGAVVLASCGGGGDDAFVEPLPPAVGTYVAFRAQDPDAGARPALWLVDTGVPGVAIRLSADLRPKEHVARFEVAPNGNDVAYVTYRLDQGDREELNFTSLAAPRIVQRLFIYTDQRVAQVEFSADSERFVARVNHAPTPADTQPSGHVFLGDPDDLRTVYTLDANGANPDINRRFALDPIGANAYLYQAPGVRRAPTATIPPGLPVVTLPGTFGGEQDMRVSRDGGWLIGQWGDLYVGPTDGTVPSIRVHAAAGSAQYVTSFDADDDASHIAFVTQDADQLWLASRAASDSSVAVVMPDPAYQPSVLAPRFLPGTATFVAALRDPTLAHPDGLYLFDATGANPPLRLSGAGSEPVQRILVVDADTVVYAATNLAAPGIALRQVELAAPGAPFDLMPSRTFSIDHLSVCGDTVTFGGYAVPDVGVWAATLHVPGSATKVLDVPTGALEPTCLP